MIHEDLIVIQRLWANVHAADQLRGERRALMQQLEEAERVLEQAAVELEQASEHLEAVQTQERQVMRKLEVYRKRVTQTRKMIDDGTAPDYRLAQQQLDSCEEIADDLETEALELMEQRDEATEALQRAKQAQVDAVTTLERAHHAHEIGLPRIDHELVTLGDEQPDLEAALGPGQLDIFRDLRRRGRSVTSQMILRTCSGCHFVVPPQVAMEVERGVRVHTCRNCSRFLVPPE